MIDDESKRVTDVATLKAVAHPLRMRLLGALRLDGPATASELARRFDESSGSTSYHLRELAKYGFVEPDAEQPNARDKRWRATAEQTSWRTSEFRGSPEGVEAMRSLRQRQLEGLLRTIENYEDNLDAWDDAWADAGGLSDYIGRLRPDSARELMTKVGELIAHYRDADRDADDAETVRVYFATIPVAEGGAEHTI